VDGYNGGGMNRLSSLSLVTGTACNFSCPYCLQRRDAKRLRFAEIARFLDCLKPHLADEVWLGFHGGEPLLQWPLIERVTRHAARAGGVRFRFALTSNGSRLGREHIRFFRRHGFDLGISCDGLAQAQRDAGSVAAVERALEELRRLYPGGYTVLSVFTPATVPLLAASVGSLMRRGHARLRFALDAGASWSRSDLAVFAGQLERLAEAARRHRRRGVMPVENFLPGSGQGVFACAAGRGRLALLPDRSVWGCERIAALAARHPGSRDIARFRFGGLDEFAAGPERALAAAARALPPSQDFFLASGGRMCGLCPELERCAVCPATAAWRGGVLGLLPGWVCRAARLVRQAAERVQEGAPAAAKVEIFPANG